MIPSSLSSYLVEDKTEKLKKSNYSTMIMSEYSISIPNNGFVCIKKMKTLPYRYFKSRKTQLIYSNLGYSRINRCIRPGKLKPILI